MAFRDVLVILRPYPAQLSQAAVDYAATVATALGALVLARAVDDPKLSNALREAALNHLTPTG